jgi:hypothetical protein
MGKLINNIVYISEQGSTFTKDQIIYLIKEWLKDNNIAENESIINKLYNYVFVVVTGEHINTILDRMYNEELENILK